MNKSGQAGPDEDFKARMANMVNVASKLAMPSSVIPDLGDSIKPVSASSVQWDTFATKEGSDVITRAYNHADTISSLFRSYMQRLVDDKLMLKLSQVKKMDILDATALIGEPTDEYSIPRLSEASEEEREAIEKLGWYSIVPCFEEGALKLNKFRYIVFEIQEMDPERQTTKIRLYDYMKIDGLWQTGIATTIIAKDLMDGNGKTHHIIINHEEDLGFVELYTMYTAKELGWSDKEYQLWLNTIVKNSQITCDRMMSQYKTTQYDQMANIFIKIIGRCNAALELNKPSRPVKKDSPAGTSAAKRTVTYQKGEAPERKIRNVGKLRVQSKDIPRKPCLETVITYKVAKWTVRGHIRHYKSGKEVYIKPGVRERKALADTGEMTATTIRFRKRTGKKEEQ